MLGKVVVATQHSDKFASVISKSLSVEKTLDTIQVDLFVDNLIRLKFLNRFTIWWSLVFILPYLVGNKS